MTTRLPPQSLIDWLPLRDEESGQLVGRYSPPLNTVIVFYRGRDVRFRLDELAMKAKTLIPRHPARLSFGD